MMSRRRILWLLFVLPSLVLTGCWYSPPTAGPAPRPEGQGDLAITATLASPGASAGVWLDITLQGYGMLLQHALPVENGRAEGTLHGVYAGEWAVLLEVRDDEGYTTHRGTSTVEIAPGSPPVPLQIELHPLPGRLQLRAELTGFAAADAVGRARLVREPGGIHYNAIRGEGDDYIEWNEELPAGSHDLRIELYGESFHHYRLIYPGDWFTVDIRPGRHLDIVWHPSTGEVAFVGLVHTPPPAPHYVTARVDGLEVVVEWQPTPPYGTEAVIYWTSHPSQHPRELARVPYQPGHPGPYTFRHFPDADGVTGNARLTYSVAQISEAGLVGFRRSAPPVYWP